MRYLSIFIVLISACAHPLRNVNRAAMVIAAATIACDWGSTRWHAKQGWKDYSEDNPLLGSAPNVTTVDAYMLSVTFIGGIISLAPPDWARLPLYAGVTAIEAKAVVNNTALGTPLCGI